MVDREENASSCFRLLEEGKNPEKTGVGLGGAFDELLEIKNGLSGGEKVQW